jgi:heme exporter protein A
LLEARELSARRGELTLFANLNFALAPGRALLVTGRNGSGKTTLLRIAAGLSHVAEGTLLWRGIRVDPFAPALRADALYIGHASALKEDLSAEENLASLAALHGFDSDARAVRQALAMWSIGGQRTIASRVLSQGQRRRVGLARLSLERRALWILDEPTTALDAAGSALLRDVLHDHLASDGVALIATHQDIGLSDRFTQTLELQ